MCLCLIFIIFNMMEKSQFSILVYQVPRKYNLIYNIKELFRKRTHFFSDDNVFMPKVLPPPQTHVVQIPARIPEHVPCLVHHIPVRVLLVGLERIVT